MKATPLFVFLLLSLSSASFASGSIRVSGDEGTPYSIQCKDAANKDLKFEGRAPSEHNFEGKHPLKTCKLQKHAQKGQLEFFYVQAIKTDEGTQVFNFAEQVLLKKAYEKKTIELGGN